MTRHPRWLGALLAVVLAGIPVVQTVCTLTCGPEAAAAEVVENAGHEGHCSEPELPAAECAIAAAGDCTACDPVEAPPRTSVRNAAADAALPPSASVVVDLPASGAQLNDQATRAASPPFPPIFPLRI